MGCQGAVILGDSLTFTVVTHDPDTGVLTDADAVPAYRVYEDETAASILTGNMAFLDAVNTTGFYSAQIDCTAANGFEDGKSYNIYVTATVDGDEGGITFGVRCQTDVWSAPVRTLTVAAGAAGTVISGSSITLHRGDTFTAAITSLGDISASSKLWFSAKRRPVHDTDAEAIIMIDDDAGLLVLNGAVAGTPANGSITVDDATAGDITVVLDEAETDDLAPTKIYYDVQMLANNDVTTLTQGPLTISEDVTRAIT